MFDVIEHFERRDAEALLDKLEQIFRVVLIFTPRGFLQQDWVTHPNLRDDPLMWHRCGFTELDFAARGYLTFFWPIFHFPTGQSPHGAVLAIRVRNSSVSEIERLRLVALQEHRHSLLATPALRLFLTRAVAWKIAGNKGIEFLARRAFR
jgi:hypothetical protein